MYVHGNTIVRHGHATIYSILCTIVSRPNAKRLDDGRHNCVTVPQFDESYHSATLGVYALIVSWIA